MARRLVGPLYGGSVALGVITIGIGARWLQDGEAMSHDWGVPFPPNAAATGARKPLVAYTAAAGVRDVAFGSAILTMALLRDRRAVGVFALAGSIAGVGDGVIARHFGATPLQTAIHWTPGFLCAAFGAVLLL